jgi:hypothetical protein
MNKTDPPARGRIHRSSFAGGEARPDLYSEDDHVGSFAEGQADSASYHR